VRSALRESQPGPCHEVRDDSGNENFVGLRERHDACRRVHGYAADISTSDFNFACMEAGARRQANLFCRRAKRQRTANCAARSIERRQYPIAGRLDQNTAMVCNGLNRQPVVTIQQSSPGLIPYLGGATRGINDIRNSTVQRTRSRSPDKLSRWPVTNSSMSPSNASTSPVKKE
jgi:hypothetical protein